MKMPMNQDVRCTATKEGVRLWEIAEKYGCTDSTFSRKLRRELSKTEKEEIFAIISRIKQSREAQS